MDTARLAPVSLSHKKTWRCCHWGSLQTAAEYILHTKKRRRARKVLAEPRKSSLGRIIKLQMYIFILGVGVFPRISVILAGVERGGENASLCPIFFAFPKWDGGRCFYIPCCIERDQRHSLWPPALSEHVAYRAAWSPSHSSTYFQKQGRTLQLLVFSTWIFSTSLPEHDIFYFADSLAHICGQSS